MHHLTTIAIVWAWLAPVAIAAEGLASWYGEDHRGRLMANGKPFNPDRMTAASWDMPLGTWVTVRGNGRRVEVQITDRGPNKRLKGRIIDLSAAAFKRLEHPRKGLVKVRVNRR